MVSEDKKEFAGLIAILDQTFNSESSNLKVKVYFEVLKHFEIEDVKKAIYKSVASLKFYPKPAELIQLIIGDTQSRALQAWLSVVKALEEVGTYQSVQFDDPVIHFCIESMGGWRAFAEITQDKMPFKQREFERLYELVWDNPERITDKSFEHLSGFFEIDNSLKGLLKYIPKPVAIKTGLPSLSKLKLKDSDEVKKLDFKKIQKDIAKRKP